MPDIEGKQSNAGYRHGHGDVTLWDRRKAVMALGSAAVAGLPLLGGCSVARATSGVPAMPRAGWATGGTAAMSGKARYPNPFVGALNSCTLTGEQILGPCWAPRAPVRQDISDGEPGIPMRAAFRLVSASTCKPIAGAELEIWHANNIGHYSANDVEGGAFCTGNDAYAISKYFFRGRAITDGDGIAIFDSCFPGWYDMRALHIHLLVRMPEHVGEANTRNMQTVTQFYFPEPVIKEVFSTVPGYSERGQPKVSLANDMISKGSKTDPSDFLFAVERMDDGAMLVSKTIFLSTQQTCGSREMTPLPGSPPPPQMNMPTGS